MSNIKTDSLGRSALHLLFIEQTHIPIVQDLEFLFEQGFDLNLRDTNGWSPLHFAAQQWVIEGASKLLELGAQVDIEDNHGNTPLWRAVFCSNGRGKMIQLLLSVGADPDYKNHNDVSPRELARLISNYNVIKYFD